MKKSHVIEIAIILTLAGLFLAYLRPVQIGGDTLFMVVYGGSMQPEINGGDLAIVKNVDPREIVVGEVITFYTDGKFVTHRVVDVLPNGFVTKGDANNAPDIDPVYSNNVIGKVVFVVPYFGYVIHYAGTFWGLVTLVWIPAAALIALEIKNILKTESENEKESVL